jgi:hypothetical protein
MQCFFVATIMMTRLLVLSFVADGNQLESFGDLDQCLKTLRNFTFKTLAVIFFLSNMLTGQNAFSFFVN